MSGKYELIIIGLDIVILLLIAFKALNFLTFAILIALMTTVLFIQKIEMQNEIEELSDRYDSLSKIFFSRMDELSKKVVEIKVEMSKKLIEIGNRLSARFDEEDKKYNEEMRTLMSKIISIENRITEITKDIKTELESARLRIKRIEFELGLLDEEHVGE